MKRCVYVTLLCAIVAIAFAPVRGIRAAEESMQPRIQIAILLDTSGSMSGLIAQAKTELWRIVNEFALARRDGVAPRLEVALYEYGNNGLPSEEGWIRMILPLTDDLDKMSEELFALTTNGGSEFCGQVIQHASRELAWSDSNGDVKAIFIAGNEPFTQGPVDYREACRTAIAAGVVVNTIHCGDERAGIKGQWHEGAALADGSALNINHNRGSVHVDAPQDAEIIRLGELLNTTYVAYGPDGFSTFVGQARADAAALSVAPAVGAQRSMAKASMHYRNARWDLVDALAEGTVAIGDVDDKHLPEEMQTMTAEERAAYVAGKAKEREEIKAKINALNAARRKFVEARRKALLAEGEDTLDVAVIRAARASAAARGFEFVAPEAPAAPAGE